MMSLTDLARMVAEVFAVEHGGPSARVEEMTIDEIEIEGDWAFVKATVRCTPIYLDAVNIDFSNVPITRAELSDVPFKEDWGFEWNDPT